MKQFSSIREALQYQKICPICEEYMAIDLLGAVMKDKDIVWALSPNELHINQDTDEVKIVDKPITYPKIIYQQLLNTVVSGLEFVRLGMVCEDCYQYEYVIQIVVDMTNKKIANIYLNSETITIEDDAQTIHEITNSYAFEETEYGSFHRSKGRSAMYPKADKCVKLPLIPLDIHNPLKTVDRIKSLIVYL